jgi:hypothetical protein
MKRQTNNIPMPYRIQQPSIDWSQTKQYFNEHTASGYAMAIIEADKIIKNILTNSRFPGKSPEQKLAAAKSHFTNYIDIIEARKKVRQIIEDQQSEVTPEEATWILRTYHTTIEEIINAQTMKGTRVQIFRLKLIEFYYTFSPSWKKIGISTFAFLLIVVFLDNTKLGNTTALLTARAAEFMLTWVLVVAGISMAIIFTVFGSLAYFDKRREQKKLLQHNDS